MTEAERAAALKNVQLELFQLKKEYSLKRRELKRKFLLLHGKGQKRCRKCKDAMDVEQFYLDNRYADGRYPYCRECQIAKVMRKGNIKSGRAA